MYDITAQRVDNERDKCEQAPLNKQLILHPVYNWPHAPQQGVPTSKYTWYTEHYTMQFGDLM